MEFFFYIKNIYLYLIFEYFLFCIEGLYFIKKIYLFWIQIHLILSSIVHRIDWMSNACAIPRANIDRILSYMNRTKFNITLNKNTQYVGFSRLLTWNYHLILDWKNRICRGGVIWSFSLTRWQFYIFEKFKTIKLLICPWVKKNY
jgi:hypothetical protein